MNINFFLKEIENKYPVHSWENVAGISLWHYLALKLYVKSVPSPDQMGLTVKSNSAMVMKIFNQFRRLNKLIKKSPDILFFSSASYRNHEGDKYYDRFCDPVADTLSDLNISSCILESGRQGFYHNSNYKDERVFQYYELEILTSRLVSKQKITACQFSDLKEVIDQFNKRLAEDGIDFRFSIKEILASYAALIKRVKFFEKLYRRIRPRAIFIICFYSERGMPVTIAANNLNIPLFDIQHGIQGAEHIAYNGFIPKDSAFSPTGFWKWDGMINPINDLKIEYPWLSFWKRHFKKEQPCTKDFVLYSLQPLSLEILFRKEIIELIKKTSTQFKWILRLHPRMTDVRENLLKFLAENEILSAVEIQSGDTSLMKILTSSRIHVTNWSSVCIEAKLLNIPTLFLHEKAPEIFTADKMYVFGVNLERDWNEVIRLPDQIAQNVEISLNRSIENFLNENGILAKTE